MSTNPWSFRWRVVLAVASLFAAVTVACGGGGGAKPTPVAGSPTVAPAATPPCSAESRLTPDQTDDPYFKAGSPERSLLIEPTTAGTRFTLSGTVMSTDCKPIAGALLDFWQADENGVYDNDGYRLRGHQTSDASGRYKLETIIPGLYTGRTEHIHVKVQAPDKPMLTTQLYFAGVLENATDAIFNPALVMDVQQDGTGKVAGFDFVIAAQ